ncbi:LptF/LptG family permease [bacterium]|nr:LptF/LptG family permease [bacterium]
MKLIDRYIAFRFISRLIWSVIAAIVVFIVLDMVEMLGKFIDADVPASVVFQFYYLYIPYIAYLILPVATLLATMFTIGSLTISNELVAMHASGISFYRSMGWLLLLAVLIAAITFLFGETIVPEANKQRLEIYRYDLKKIPRESRASQGHIYVQIDEDTQLSIDRFNPISCEAFGLQIVDVDKGRLKGRVDAEKMIWRDSAWHLQGAVRREFNEQGDVTWLTGYNLSEVIKIGLKPDQMEKVQIKPEEMNYIELRNYIKKQKSIGANIVQWKVDLLFKVSMPVATVVIVLFGAPIASIRRRSGMVLGFGMALFICFIYFGFIQVGKVLGYKAVLDPFVSAWAGNIFFGLIGLTILFKWARG